MHRAQGSSGNIAFCDILPCQDEILSASHYMLIADAAPAWPPAIIMT